MKLKKLFAGVVAAAMMLTMAVPAFATETGASSGSTSGSTSSSKITVDSDGHAYLTVTKNFKVLKGTAPDSLTFDFTLTNDGADSELAEGTATPAHESTYHVTFSKADNNNADLEQGYSGSKTFKIDLAALGINHVGKYTYKLSETQGNVPGVTYDSELKLVVSCVNADANNPGSGFAYYVGVHRGDDKSPAVFNNYYGKDGENGNDTVHKVTLTKDVKGEFADINKIFKFKVNLTMATNNSTADDYKGASVTHSASDTHGSATSYLTYGKDHYVYLKRGESVDIGNLPDGVKCTITEISSDDTDVTVYTTTINGGSDITGTAERKYEGIAFVKGNTDQTAAYVNTREGSPDMGVILDNAPYIALLTIVAVGAVFMVIKKRRNYED